MHDAQSGDVYADSRGKLWRCVGRWDEPVIIMQEIEVDSKPAAKMQGGITGLMWDGFTLILRPKRVQWKVHQPWLQP